MRAIFYERYGGVDVLQYGQRPAPAQRSGWVRVRVEAAALNPKDILIRKGKMRWLARAPLPRIPGFDFSGVLMDPLGEMPAGAAVFGMVQEHCGGTCAEVVSVRPDWLAARPPGLPSIDAAGLPLAGLTALQALRDELSLQRGQRVLLNGASGGVGTLAIQVAKILGAEVVAVCSGRNDELVRDLGADHVIDYTLGAIEERDVDCVFDIFGNLPWSRAREMLRTGGRYCTTVPRPGSVVRGALRRVGAHRAALVVVQSRRADLNQLARWISTGELRPVTDCVVPMSRPELGHQRIETKRARGKVVIDVSA